MRSFWSSHVTSPKMRATVRSWRLLRAAPKQSTRAAVSVLSGAATLGRNGSTSAVEVTLKSNATGAVATQAIETMHSSSSSMSFAVASAIAAAAVAASGQDAQAEEAPKKDEKRLEYSEVVEILREQVSEFRTTLKSTESRIPKAYPIQKIAISRAHAPNGVSTIRIEFVCPPFVDQEAILGRFLLKLQEKASSLRQPVEVVGAQSGDVDSKSIVESYDLPSVSYLYADGHGSFQFVRDASMQRNKGTKFVFYKDEYLTPGEVDAIVEAYKELYSYPNVHSFFNHDHNQMRRRMLEDRGRKGPNLTVPSPSKDEAIQQLQRLGIDVFEPVDNENGLNWDSLAGYDDVKLEIEDTIVLALQNPELYDRIARKTRCRYESNRPRAILFEGPPGTGKTLSARIIAQQAGIPMIHIPIESVVSKWYGDSEKKMSAIFDACEKFDGAIIFIDEIDALAGDRAHGSMHEASRRILSVLLQKVEGFASAKKTTVICATNRKQDLDSALISRFDLCIRYELPNESTRRAVFARYAKQLNSNEVAQLASVASGLSCRDIKEICEYAERKWASKVLKKEVTDDLPPLQAYIDATKVHIVGISNGGSQNDVYA